MCDKNLFASIQACETEYKKFMQIDVFPHYEIQTKKVSIETAVSQGFESVASSLYIPNINKQIIVVSTNLQLSKYVLFHEFTHMLDSELYANRDKIRYAKLTGYTEYHASQIELMQLLNFSTIFDKRCFSMNDVINTISGTKTVQDYVNDKYQHTVALFSHRNLLSNFELLKAAFGVLYNFYGLRSICNMYADDFKNFYTTTFLKKILSSNSISEIDSLMNGWLNDPQIEKSLDIYWKTILPLLYLANQ